MLSYLIGGGFIATPFIFRFTGSLSTLRLSKDIFLYFLLMLIVFFYEKVNEIEFKHKLCLILITVFAFVHTEIFAIPAYWRQFQLFSSGIAFLYILSTAKIDYKIIKASLMILCLIESSWVLLNTFDFEFYKVIFTLFFKNVIQVREEILNVGSLGNPNLSGALIAITSPLFFSRKYFLLLIPIIAAIILGGSIMPIMTFIAGILYFLWLNLNLNKYLPYVLFSIAGIFFIVNGFPQGFLSDNSRLEAWTKTINFLDNYVFGKGLGHYSMYFSKKYVIENQLFKSTHNEYLQLFYNFGFSGLTLFFIPFIGLLNRCKNKIILSCIFAISVNCYGNFLFHISLTAFVALAIFAIGYVKENNESTMERKSIN